MVDLDPNADPAADEKDPPILAEVGASGLNHFSGFIEEEYHKDLQGAAAARVFREMMDHPQIGTGLFIIDMFARRVPIRVEPSGKSDAHAEATALIETAIEDLPAGVGGVLSSMITALPFGWSWLEKVFKISRGRHPSKRLRSKFNDGKIRWRKMAIRSQESLERWDLDENGEVRGMWQRAAPDYVLRYLPRKKSLHIRMFNRKENPEGYSVLRPAYIPWHFQKHLQFVEAVGISRNMAGFPLVEVPLKLAAAKDGTAEKTLYDTYVNMAKKIAADEYACVVMPSETGPDGMPTGFRFRLVSSSGRNPAETDTPIRRHRTDIAMVLLMGLLLLGEKAGSYSLGETQFELMALMIEALIQTGLDALNDEAVPELLELNGMDPRLAPTITHGKLVPADLAKLGAFITAAFGSGALTPDDATEEHLREEASFPKRDPETARMPEMAVPDMSPGFGLAPTSTDQGDE